MVGSVIGAVLGAFLAMGIGWCCVLMSPNDPTAGSVATIVATAPGGFLTGMAIGIVWASKLADLDESRKLAASRKRNPTADDSGNQDV